MAAVEVGVAVRAHDQQRRLVRRSDKVAEHQ